MNKLLSILILISFSFPEEYLAVMTLEPMNITEAEANILSERLTSKLISLKKYVVIERANIEKVLKEQKFQYSGCTNTQCAVEIGKMLNSNYIVIGNVSKLGSTYSIDCRIIDVETVEAISSASFMTKGDIDDLFVGIDNVAMQLYGFKTYVSSGTAEPKKGSYNVSYKWYFDYEYQKELFESRMISVSKSDMRLNGKKLSEIEFLNQIGLEDEAEKIMNNYNARMDEYESEYKKLEKEYLSKSELAKETYVERTTENLGCFDAMLSTKPNQGIKISKPLYYIAGGTGGMGIYKKMESDQYYDDWQVSLEEQDWMSYADEHNNSQTFNTIALVSLGVGLVNDFVKLDKTFEITKYRYPEYQDLVAEHLLLVKPRLEQTMSYDEMVLLAETYNQTLYGDIVNKVINPVTLKSVVNNKLLDKLQASVDFEGGSRYLIEGDIINGREVLEIDKDYLILDFGGKTDTLRIAK